MVTIGDVNLNVTVTRSDHDPTERIARRCLPPVAARLAVARRDDGPSTITGYGAVFYREGDEGTEFRLWADIVERIRPGAFDRAIREDDVRSFFNHDPNWVLGRNRAGTLRLSVDQVGLRYEIDAPDTQAVRDHVISPIERGDLDGSSFMFIPRRVTWEEVSDGEQALVIRWIEEVELWEVGPVVFPAYESTTSGVRGVADGEISLAEARASHARWRGELEEAQARQREEVERVSVYSRATQVRESHFSRLDRGG